jgi:hypothetical protein
MAEPNPFLKVKELLIDQKWRLNNLYRIIDKTGQEVKFTLNAEQEALYDNRWYQNLILKARQLGFSTYIAIFMLDCSLFDANTACGIVDATIDDAKGKLAKIKFAYEGLPADLQTAIPIKTANAYELEFTNGSSICVGTSHRGGTLQILHVSEYGKICAKSPDRAREIRTGALNTIQAGQIVFIESTAEGQEGGFYTSCQIAQSKARLKTKLTPLDFKFHFYGWYLSKDYTIDPTGVFISDNRRDYFELLRLEHGIQLTPGQMAWYVKKEETQDDDMKREFPSTPEEAFAASIEGAYYGKQMAIAENEGRVCKLDYEPSLPVETAWDIGMDDETAIWFFQRFKKECRIIDYYERSDEYLPHFVEVLNEKPYKYSMHWFPHDVKVREWGAGKSRIQSAIDYGITPTKVPDHKIADRIHTTRILFKSMIFDADRTAIGRKAVKSYRKEWDDERATWRDKPYHNWASNGADALGYLAMIFNEEVEKKPQEPKPIRGLADITIDELWNEKRQDRNFI